MDRLTQKAVIEAINHMFHKKTYFDICTVDTILKITGAHRGPHYEKMRLYHCRNYSEIDSETKSWLYQMTVETITTVPDFPVLQFAEPAPAAQALTVIEKPSFLSKLLKRS